MWEFQYQGHFQVRLNSKITNSAGSKIILDKLPSTMNYKPFVSHFLQLWGGVISEGQGASLTPEDQASVGCGCSDMAAGSQLLRLST